MARISYTEGYSDKSVLKQIYDVKRDIDQLWEDKQDVLTAGDGIRIENGVVENTEIPDVDKAYVDGAVAGVSAEVGALESEMDALEGRLTVEETARVNADAVLQENINAERDARIAADKTKQDKLVSGQNIATINGSSILFGGDIQLPTEAGAKVLAVSALLRVLYSNNQFENAKFISGKLFLQTDPYINVLVNGNITKNGNDFIVYDGEWCSRGNNSYRNIASLFINATPTLNYMADDTAATATTLQVTDIRFRGIIIYRTHRGVGMRISYKEGYDDQSVLKQLWDDRVDIEDLQMGTMQYPVDTEIDRTSRFPVQNQVIARALDGKQDAGDYVDHVTLDTMLANYVTEMQLTDTVTLIDEKLAGKQDVGDYVTSDVMDERLRGYATVQDVGIMRDNLTMEIDGKMDKDVLIRKIHVGSANPPDAGIGENGDLYIWRP